MGYRYDLGFLGGGQLARMSIHAAQRPGLKCVSLDPGSDTPASQVADALQGSLSAAEDVAKLLQSAEFITLENEFIPAETIRSALALAQRDDSCILPGVDCLATIQDKFLQRQAYARHGVPSPRAVALDPTDTESPLGYPVVLKARFGGYDGKGTRYARTQEEFDSHAELWRQGGWMADEFVPFRRELAVMVARSTTQTFCFPTMETVQKDHVCDLVFPSGTDASDVAIAAVEAVGGYGLFGVELFETEDGQFSVNEIAPRPHNTGHYTLDWGGISQFEMHVRLVMGWPLVRPQGNACTMANLLGQPDVGDFHQAIRSAIEAVPEARFHWYGKAEAKPGRKMGHINVQGENGRDLAVAARDAFYKAWTAQ